MQRQKFHQKLSNTGAFYQPSFSNTQFTIGTENYPAVFISFDYLHDIVFQAHIEIFCWFRHETKDETI